MSEHYLKVYKKYDFKEVQSSILLYGALQGICGNCKEMNLKLDQTECPSCKTKFNYIAFQNLKDHAAKLEKLLFERPYLTIVDHDDFKRQEAAIRAKNILG